MRGRRALAALALATVTAALAAGCGGDDTADLPPAATAPAVAAAPVAVASVAPGEVVRAGAETPKPVAKALAGTGVIVVAFVLKGPADDQSVAAALSEVRSDDEASRGARFFTYTVGTDRFGDLADLLGVTGTPSVAVIARDRSLTNLFSGLVDADILRQAIADARDTAAGGGGGATP